MAGATFLSPEPEPSASRVVMVRTLDDAPLDGSNRYMTASAGAVAEDIANLGLHVQEPDKIKKLLYDFLVQGSGVDQVDPALQSTLSAAFDPVHLRGADEG
jgi:hypothetical protein